MAFTGSATKTLLGKHVVRVTGLSLGGNSSGTIGLYGDSGAGVQLPQGFAPVAEDGLTLSDLIKVDYVNDGDAGGAPNESRHIHVTKSEGPFRVTFANDQTQATAIMEIWFQFFHSIIR